ncbi:Fe-S cluster assembly ATPase SufC [Candidatus Babeliales bacterium]|nr:Fe-S cluster assembly ATPase SufC [Candidatus Babeliales bacterium]
MNNVLTINNLHAAVEDKTILNGIQLAIKPGQVHAIMGPNGSGKSSLAFTLMGHPRYAVKAGSITLAGNELNDLSPDKRAKQGMFLAMQHPYEIDGVVYKDFLRQAYNALYDGTEKQLRIRDFHALLLSKVALLKMDPAFIDRFINVGFSGGEKKRAEILQLAVLQPKIAILDEIDSGLDIDALKVVCEGLRAVKHDNPDMAILMITHYQRILQYLTPDVVHVLRNGQIVKSGDATLADQLEAHGYDE